MENNSEKKALLISVVAGTLIASFFLFLFLIGIRLFYAELNEPEDQGNEREILYQPEEEIKEIEDEIFPEKVQVVSYPIVETNQTDCFDNAKEINCSTVGEKYYGQDGDFTGNRPSYTDNQNGTITDNVTGLVWTESPGEKLTYQEALEDIESFELAGHTDWRIPTIKELYSLIDFTGIDPNPEAQNSANLKPFISDTFDFEYGDPTKGERIIDSQYGSSTVYVSKTGPRADDTLFGVNFADGRIKGYGMVIAGSPKSFYFLYVRGEEYGLNDFAAEENIVTDYATALEWTKEDSERAMNWEDALSYCNQLNVDERSDWRLPNIKELHTILDYTRSPDTSDSPAINPLFNTTSITNEDGEIDYGYYWSSTTHLSDGPQLASRAAYLSFGRAMGFMNQNWYDVHGAGAQRSDPKSGDPAKYPTGLGPQGDAIRIENFVRCVRDI